MEYRFEWNFKNIKSQKDYEEFIEDMLKEDQVKKQYTLQPGDTLKQIALKNNVGLDRIFKNNPDLLKKRNKLQGKEELML